MMDMEGENENKRTFDLGSLRINLPQNKRGLSRYYSGKSRSFTCMADVHCVEDLKKQERPNVKKRKKQMNRQGVQVPPLSCRRVFSSSQCATPIIGV